MIRFKKSIAILTVIATVLSVFIFSSAPAVSAAGTETPFYKWKQYDPQWKDVYIGSNTIGNIGCYATSAAMLIVYGGLRTEKDFDPATFVQEMKAVGGFSGNLIYKGRINKAVPGFDYDKEVLLGKTQTEKAETIGYYLNKGYYIIAGVKNLGHYVAIREVKNGVVYMMDPASECDVLFDYYSLSGVTKIFLYTSTGKKVPIDSDSINNGDSSSENNSPYSTGIYKTTDNLNLRQSATTSSSALTIIPGGTELTITETTGIWGKTSYGGYEGYVSLEYATFISEGEKDPFDTSSEDVTSEEPSSDEPSSEEPSSDEPSSEEPSSDEPSSEEPSSNEPSSEEPSSEEPSSDDTTSDYSSEDNVSSEAPQYVPGRYKMEGNVYLRKSPSTSSASLTIIPKGTEIIVTEVDGKWGKTSYGGYDGYCGLTYSKLLEAFEQEEPKKEIPVLTITTGTDKWITSSSDSKYHEGYYTTTDNLSLRESNSTSSSRLAIIPAGTKVKVTEVKNGWGKVVYNQLSGWCSLEYCKFDEAYLKNTVFSAANISGVLSEAADLSNVYIDQYYSDGSVYRIKSGITVSYTIPTTPSVITATAKHEDKTYTFKILYASDCSLVTDNGNLYFIVKIEKNAKDIFGDSAVQIKTGATNQIDGINFTVVVAGDMDGSNSLTSTDYLKIKLALSSLDTIDKVSSLAADYDGNGRINSTDYLTLKINLTT